MPQPEDNQDPLDALLREEDRYIEDAGFTPRLVASLPPRRKPWLRPAILTGATLLGLVLFIWCVPLSKDFFRWDANGGIVLHLNWTSVLAMTVLAAGAVSLAWGVYAMLRWED